ncbi:D-serine ammonia-lyase [Fusibacter bizertensis]
MNDNFIFSKDLELLISNLKSYKEQIWINPYKKNYEAAMASLDEEYATLPTLEDILDADLRLKRFAPLFQVLFPETIEKNGLIESDLVHIENFQWSLITFVGGRILGKWSTKLDSHLEIAGSVKARGGVYEVIYFAEQIALENGLITLESDYSILSNDQSKALFSKYTLVVGSTGNLGLSIGIIGSALGFKVAVHMSQDAKAWKINLLKSKGVEVILHTSDYSKAVEEGRKSTMSDPYRYFIDDENSILLFTGYAVAALRIKDQLMIGHQPVDADHPLFVYLPCGVGGAPGGIAYGLKLVYGDDVRIFLAEPTHAPSMLLGLATQKHHSISVGDIGLDTITDADGLAVGRPSGFVGHVITSLIDGVYTVADDTLYWLLFMLSLSEDKKLEPSALAGFLGPIKLLYDTAGFEYLLANDLLHKMENAHHISWATGGGLVPEAIMSDFIERGKKSKIEF